MTDPAAAAGQTLGCLLAIGMLVLGIVQIVAGWIGLEDAFGWGWAVAATAAFFLLRFSLPLTVGAFLCAKNVWGWHWAGALAFAAPGLILMIPSLITATIAAFKR